MVDEVSQNPTIFATARNSSTEYRDSTDFPAGHSSDRFTNSANPRESSHFTDRFIPPSHAATNPAKFSIA